MICFLIFNVIFLNKHISITNAYVAEGKKFVCQFFISFPREACLRFFIYALDLILCVLQNDVLKILKKVTK